MSLLKNQGYFNYKQCIYSNTAHENKIDNYPGSDYDNNLNNPDFKLHKDAIIFNLHRLFKYCINPIFRKFGNNLALTSVYRNKEVNKILGGVENSQHIYGHAADIVLTNNIPSSTLFNWCKINIPQYHQLIWEYPERGEGSHIYNRSNNTTGGKVVRLMNPSLINYTKFSWIHISYIEGNNQKVNSISSRNPKIHTEYKDENTFYLDNFTHRISTANQSILE
tara:strand:+ start:1750 stop:2415 length:666 start_codon:yes stop_codon:yes gene_type:complete